MSIIFKPISDSIKKKLLVKLSSSRQTIIDDDIFINEEHKILCSYYKKYIELKSKLETKNKKIVLNFMKNILIKNENNTLVLNENDNKIEYKPVEYEYNIKWNEYNKIFINKLNYVFNYNYINLFLQQQHIFISSLNTRELYNIKYYTYHGDIYLNSYIQGTFSIDIIKDYSGNLFSNENDLCYFFYQLKDYFKSYKYNDKEIDINDNDLFINFIKNECLNFDMKIYEYIFAKYLLEMNEIFKKAPKTTDKLILYRGITSDYISSKLKKDFFKNTQFTSTSLFIEKAIGYSSGKNKMILKINVPKGMSLIFVEGITLAENDFEVIIPINSIFLVKKTFHIIPFYKKKEDIICPDEDYIPVNVAELTYIQ
jgi:hypothetical protein